MNHYVKIALVLCACVALSAAQFGPYGYSDFSTSFGGPTYSAFGVAARDPRANTGPVLFPRSPEGDPSQTSGVVVGASGYGFVPPGSQGGDAGVPEPTFSYPPYISGYPVGTVTFVPNYQGDTNTVLTALNDETNTNLSKKRTLIAMEGLIAS